MPEKKSRKKSYPAFYEKIIPFAIAGLVILFIVALIVIIVVLAQAA
jgi:hypothetical protein